MLIVCDECELPVSDKAIACPHCGYPMKPELIASPKPRNKNNKRRRLPNGFGQISEIKNRNLRNPYRAMITIGKNIDGRPICKPLKPESYFPTYNDAYAALVEYNKNPYDLSPSITVIEIYERWSDEYFKTLKSDDGVRRYKGAWAYCSSVYGMRMMDVRSRHVKGCMEEGVAYIKEKETRPSAHIQKNIKTLFNLMFDYALEYELVEQNYARNFAIGKEVSSELGKTKKPHIPFTEDEMMVLWGNVGDVPYVDVVLIQCYSGWRPQELGEIKLDDVDLENWTFKGGGKTDAGKDRVVPIHPRIRDFVTQRYEQAVGLDSGFLINDTHSDAFGRDIEFRYSRYRKWFGKIITQLMLNENHRPHDGRKHFVTQAKKYKLDEYSIKYMVGHAIDDITEKVYTDRDPKWLHEEIEKIE